MSLLYGDTVTLLRASVKEDPYGNPSSDRDWAHATSTPVTGVSVQPDGPSAEATADRTTTVTGWRLATPRGRDLDLVATDRIVSNGVTMEVDGEVARYTMGGSVHHIEARFKRVDG